MLSNLDKISVFFMILFFFLFMFQREEITRLKSELSSKSLEFNTCTDMLDKQNEAIKKNALISDKAMYKEAEKEIAEHMKDYKQASSVETDTKKLEAIKAQQAEFFRCQE